MPEYISLDTMSGGALREKLDIELKKLAANVLDPNTKPDAVRTVTIQLKIKPDETRQVGSTEISVKSSLAPAKGIPTSFVFDFDQQGNAVLKELKSRDRDQLRAEDDGSITDGAGTQVGKVVNGPFR